MTPILSNFTKSLKGFTTRATVSVQIFSLLLKLILISPLAIWHTCKESVFFFINMLSLINFKIKFQFKLTNVSYNILQSLATRNLFLIVTYSASPKMHANNYKVSFSCCFLAYCYFWHGFQKDSNYFEVVDGP